MLLSRYLHLGADRPYLYKLRHNTRFFQIGSNAPDLPCASLTDNNLLDSDSEIADLFHFAHAGQSPEQAPNRLPLLGLERVKTYLAQGADKKACDAFFWFLVGYASHVIADGVCHPFVMDKVGRYEGPNRAEHRALEMGIDVLLCKHFTGASGHAIEAGYARMDSFIKGFNELKSADIVCHHFAGLIESAYGLSVKPAEIRGWMAGISRLFCLATGRWPAWLRNLDASRPFVFREIADLDGREDDFLVLERPKYWEGNFRGVERVHFLDDCLPRFNALMTAFLDKAWAYVYEAGPAPDAADLPACSLDTGRPVRDFDNVALIPSLWEVTA
jgi:hypothetical protein